MKVGYARRLTKKEDVSRYFKQLESYKVEELFSDSSAVEETVTNEHSQLSEALSFLEVGDTFIIPSLEHISRNYVLLVDILKRLKKQKIKLIVIESPEVPLKNWLIPLDWVQRNEAAFHSKLKMVSIGRESVNEATKYSFWSANLEGRSIHRQIVGRVLQHHSLRKIAKEMGVSKATVFRIKKQVDQVKRTLSLVAIFFITVMCLKLAQNYTENVLVQLIICGIATLLIVYFSYMDSKSD